MTTVLLFALVGIVCLLVPARVLVVLMVVAVMLADTRILPREIIYFGRFIPAGVLALRTVLKLPRAALPAGFRIHISRAWALFFGMATLSLTYSVDPALSAQRLASAGFVLVGFGVGVPLFFSRSEDLLWLVKLTAMVLGGGVLFSLVFAQSGTEQMLTTSPERTSGIFVNPNTLGLLAMQAIFLLVYWWQADSRRTSRAVLGVALVAMSVAVLTSGSRASALGLLAGLLVLFRGKAQLERRIQRYLFRMLVILVATATFIELAFPEYLAGLLRFGYSGRMILWQRAWQLTLEAPFLGVGFGASDEVFFRDSLYLRSIGVFVAGAHSSLMRLLVDLGFTGAILAIGAFASIIRRAVKHLRRFPDPQLGVALMAVVTASLVNSIFEAWLFGFGSSSTIPFWLCLAILSFQADVADYRARQVQARRLSLDAIPAYASPAADGTHQ